MGLDMYVYKMRKLSDREAQEINGLTFSGLKGINKNYIAFSEKEMVELGKTLYADVKPFLTAITYKSTTVKQKELRRDRKLASQMVLGSCDYYEDKREWILYWFDKENPNNEDSMYRMVLTKDQMEKYLAYNPSTLYVVERQEIGYWRAQHELRERVHKATQKKIENCGYYAVNKAMSEELVKAGLAKKFLKEAERKSLCYLEWY